MSIRATDDLAALASRPGQLELEDPAQGSGVGEPGEGVGVGQSLEPFRALGGQRPETGPIDRHRGQVGDRLEDDPVGVADLVGRRTGERDDAHAHVDAVVANDEGQDRVDHRRPVGALVDRSERWGQVAGRGQDAMALDVDRCLERPVALGGHPDRRAELEPGPVRIFEEGHGQGHARRRDGGSEQGRERLVELAAVGQGGSAGGQRVGQSIHRVEISLVPGGMPDASAGPLYDRPIRGRLSTDVDPPRILRAMKLIVAVVHNEDAGALVDALLEKDYRATRLHSSGGFLKQSNATILVGVEEAQIEEVLEITRKTCTARTQIVNPMPPIMEPGEFFMPYPLEVEVGGATVFVLPVERFERL